MSETQDTTIFMLPLKPLENIFHFLGLKEKRSVRLVCHFWRAIIDTPQLGCLYFRASIQDGESATYLLNSFRTFETVRMDNLHESFPIFKCRNKFPRIKFAQLGPSNTTQNVFKFLKYGAVDSESLLIDHLSLGNVPRSAITLFLNKTAFNNVTELQIIIYACHMTGIESSIKHADAVERFLSAVKAPNLKKFRLNLTSLVMVEVFSIPDLMVAYYKCLDRHVHTVNFLELIIMKFDVSGPMFGGEQTEIIIPEEVLSKEFFNSIQENIKLNTFSIRAINLQNIYVCPCLASENLSELTWYYAMPDSGDKDEAWLKTIIDRNQKTLTSIDMRMNSLKMELLQNCKQLRHLKISADLFVDSNIQIPTLEDIEVDFMSYDLFHEGRCVICDWITFAFKNVKGVTLGIPLTVAGLEVLLNLSKLRKVKYFTHRLDNREDGIQGFCTQTGLTFESSQMSPCGSCKRVIRRLH